ncbi:MAG TPA: branched-chain amino acid ABC transporter permease [Actinobacteria bacterium]|jgi:branched-chain amino acid transport system permease protein|nr:branched-chain amino acid ABC transporter permease [Actinomycetota bacterium]
MAVVAKQEQARGFRPSPGLIGGAVFLLLVAAGVTVGVKSGVCEKSFSIWVQFAINGLTVGSLYAMIALGYTLVYGVLQLLNFAHSEVFMIGTFAGLYAIRSLFGITDANHPNGLSGVFLLVVLLAAILLAGLASGGVAMLMERVAYRPLRKAGASRLNYLITAIGVSLFLSNLFLLLDGQSHLGIPKWPNIAGRGPVFYPTIMPQKNVFTIFHTAINNLEVLVVVVAVVMLVMLDLFVHRTRAGKGIRAVAEDPETASLMGVNINAIIVLTFFVGGVMAGGAGLLYGLFFGQAQFNIGFVPGIKAFTAAVLGGIGNIRGAMLGGILLGLIENLGSACTGLQWEPVIAFGVLVGVLMFRPTGLLGERVGG